MCLDNYDLVAKSPRPRARTLVLPWLGYLDVVAYAFICYSLIKLLSFLLWLLDYMYLLTNDGSDFMFPFLWELPSKLDFESI